MQHDIWHFRSSNPWGSRANPRATQSLPVPPITPIENYSGQLVPDTYQKFVNQIGRRLRKTTLNPTMGGGIFASK